MHLIPLALIIASPFALETIADYSLVVTDSQGHPLTSPTESPKRLKIQLQRIASRHNYVRVLETKQKLPPSLF